MGQYIYGKNAVNNALRNEGRILQLYLMKGSNDFQKANIKKTYVDKNELFKLCKSQNHQGVVAECQEYKTIELNYMIEKAQAVEYPLIIVLDQLQDPHNLGAIMRTADCIGANGVIYKKHNSVSLNQTVAKVAAGAMDTVDVAEVVNLSATLKTLKQAGYWIVGTDVNKASDYRALDYQMPIALIIGSEGKGISRLVKEECDFLIKLPMLGSISSLNASVATGIILYEINNKRYPFQTKWK